MTRPDEGPVDGPVEGFLDDDQRPRDIEAPVEDAAEQSVPANPAEEEPAEAVRPGPDVPEWDALEQSIVVNLEDEYER